MIRHIKEKDHKVFVEMVQEFYASDAVLFDIPTSHIEATFQHLIEGSPYVEGFIIEEEEDVAGYVLLSLTYSNEAGGLVVWLEELSIRDNFQGRGIGSRVLTFLKDGYAQRAKRIRLEICETNKGAERLYRSKGFSALDYKQMMHEF
ncbi:MAG: GNAT family N-acetyltransferase [Erysipelotrichaceae bacterium]